MPPDYGCYCSGSTFSRSHFLAIPVNSSAALGTWRKRIRQSPTSFQQVWPFSFAWNDVQSTYITLHSFFPCTIEIINSCPAHKGVGKRSRKLSGAKILNGKNFVGNIFVGWKNWSGEKCREKNVGKAIVGKLICRVKNCRVFPVGENQQNPEWFKVEKSVPL